MRKRAEPGPVFPAWFYGPNPADEGVYHSQEEVPEGWTRKRGIPDPIFDRPPTVILDRDELVKTLTSLNVEINPTWGNAHMKKVIDDLSTPR